MHNNELEHNFSQVNNQIDFYSTSFVHRGKEFFFIARTSTTTTAKKE
jgi:hypothetical protein